MSNNLYGFHLQLQPDENNFHELHAGSESSAAFLDILAPPYNQHDEDEDLRFDVRRDCDFYTEIRNASITRVRRVFQFLVLVSFFLEDWERRDNIERLAECAKLL